MNGAEESTNAGGRWAYECVDTVATSGAEHRHMQLSALFLARVAINAAQSQLGLYALATDAPLHGLVEAADHLDAAEQRLMAFSHAVEGGG